MAALPEAKAVDPPFIHTEVDDLFNLDDKEREREAAAKARNSQVCKNIVMVDPLAPAAVAIHFLSRPGTTIHRVFSKPQPEHELSDIHRGVKLTFAKPDHEIRFREPADHKWSTKTTAAAIKALPEFKASGGPGHVLAACEMAVEPADHLAAELGLRHNVLALSEARRDKFSMQDRLRACGLRSIHQMRYSRATPWSEVETFLAHPRLKPPTDGPDAKCQFRCVIKPVRSSGTDGVTFCSNVDEVKATFDKLLGKTNRLGVSNESVVMQELLEGIEHIVDTVSCDGIHKTTAVWQYQKGPANGSRFVYIGMKTLPSDDPMFVPLVKYIHRVIDALGVRYGPTHAEVMFCKDGAPCLVEVGSRFQGVQGMWTDPANKAVGYNQIDAMCDLLVEPEKYWALPRVPLRLLKHARQIFVISKVTGKLTGLPHEAELAALPSMSKYTFYPKKGDMVYRTVDGWTSPGNVIMVGDPADLERDYIKALEILDRDDFFAVEAAKRDDCRQSCRTCL